MHHIYPAYSFRFFTQGLGNTIGGPTPSASPKRWGFHQPPAIDPADNSQNQRSTGAAVQVGYNLPWRTRHFLTAESGAPGCSY
jgi:hypothetical protein